MTDERAVRRNKQLGLIWLLEWQIKIKFMHTSISCKVNNIEKNKTNFSLVCMSSIRSLKSTSRFLSQNPLTSYVTLKKNQPTLLVLQPSTFEYILKEQELSAYLSCIVMNNKATTASLKMLMSSHCIV